MLACAEFGQESNLYSHVNILTQLNLRQNA